MAEREKNPIWRAVEEPNYHWSRFTWRIDLASIPYFLATSNAIGAFLGGLAYWWDRKSIIDFRRERGIAPTEPSKSFLGKFFDVFDPSKARGSQRLAHT